LEESEKETGYEAVRALVPALDPAEYDRLTAAPDAWAHPVTALRRILVETRVYERLALDLLRADAPDLTILYIQGTDAIGHVFAPYAPPRAAAIGEADYARYSGVPDAYFRRIDLLLGAIREAADRSGATVLLVSDHGFKWHDGRPTSSSVAVATAGQWHRDEGIYVLWGRDVTADAALGRGGVAQVSATVLALLGLPPGRGLTGPPLPGRSGSNRGRSRLRRRLPAGASGRGRGPRRGAGREAARARIHRGRAIRVAGRAQGGETRTAASFNNEGLILAEQGRTREAKEAFARALALDPATTSARWNLSDRLWADGEHARADALLLDGLDGSTEAAARLRARLRAHVDAGDAEGGRALLQRAVRSRPQDPALRLLRGRASLDAGQCRPALDDFEVAARGQPGDPGRACVRGPGPPVPRRRRGRAAGLRALARPRSRPAGAAALRRRRALSGSAPRAAVVASAGILLV
jgi:Flp pilus assembly protein TadD